ncbi:MAG: response regulator [Planctomycetes bacterium]|nr:response regulator [Planctomycetota bacterium]
MVANEVGNGLAPHAPSLLIVDDDEVLRERLARAFRRRGFDVRLASGHAEAVSSAREESPELALVDLRMPGPGGLEVVRDLHDVDVSTNIVVLTGYGSIATAVEAMRLGASNYLPKPADVEEILAAFEKGCEPALNPVTVDYKAPSLARVEWEHINRVLTDCGGNISEAARRLGIHRRSLQRKLQKYAPRD